MKCNCENKSECPQNKNTDTMIPLAYPNGAQHMKRLVQCVGGSTSTKRYAQVAGTKEYTALTHKRNSAEIRMRLLR